jgi:transmembrane sensor
MANSKLNDPFYISTLLVKMLGNDRLTEAEQRELDNWLAADPRRAAFKQKLLDERSRNRDIKTMNSFDTGKALEKIMQRINENEREIILPRRNLTRWYQLAVAAIIIIVMGVSLKLYFDNKNTQAMVSVAKNNNTSHTNKVLLTLSNGKTINVKDLKNGQVARDANVLVNKTDSGTLDYKSAPSTGGNGLAIAFNTLTIPRAQQYHVILPDGSGVWLNAESSLKYPVAFNGKERLVELSGEAYFEVTHRADQPFKVRTNNQVVEVLGTHFNIEAYPGEERSYTTLAQGSVKVSKGNSYVVIKPGQMAVNTDNAEHLTVQPANLDEVLGWKNGLLSFSDEPIVQIMKEVARAYDIDVEYQGDIKNKRFWGIYPRAKGLANLLKNLEQTNTIHFKLQGRRVVVMP